MNVAVVGLGLRGLSTAALLAASGHFVYAYDTNDHVRRTLRALTGSVSERSVRRAVEQALALGNLRFVETIPSARAYIIGVLDADVEETARAVAHIAAPGSILVLETAVEPGTTERVFAAALHAEARSIDDYHVAHCPQRAATGALIRDLRENPRIVGARRSEDALMVRDLYASFCAGPILLTTTIGAERVKAVDGLELV